MAIATRTMYQSDTWPVLKGEAQDDSGVLDLSLANLLTIECIGAHGNIVGTATAIQPPEPDPDGQHLWNWEYTFIAADTAAIDDYKVYLKVQWDVGGTQIQTFGPDTLSVVAKPL